MALPAGVTYVTNIKGDKGHTGSLAFATAETAPWTEGPGVEMVGPESSRGAHFRIPLPMPGPELIQVRDDAVAARDQAEVFSATTVELQDVAVAALIDTPGSETQTQLNATIAQAAPIASGAPFPPVSVPSYADTMDTFTVAQVYALWDALIAAHPAELSSVNLGADQSGTYQLRKITLDGKAAATRRRRAMLVANLHGNGTTMNGGTVGGVGGDPKANAIAAYEFVKALLERREETAGLQAVYRDMVLDIVPIGNPWGFDNDHRGNSRGVDLNRDFAARTEAETQILASMVTTGGYDYLVDYHSWAQTSEPRPDTYVYYQVNHPTAATANRAAAYAFGYLSARTGRPITTATMTDQTLMRYANENGVPSITLEFNWWDAAQTPFDSSQMTGFVEVLGTYLVAVNLMNPVSNPQEGRGTFPSGDILDGEQWEFVIRDPDASTSQHQKGRMIHLDLLARAPSGGSARSAASVVVIVAREGGGGFTRMSPVVNHAGTAWALSGGALNVATISSTDTREVTVRITNNSGATQSFTVFQR